MELKWFGIFICLAHSALFSGLNLGFFGLSRLRLAIQAEHGNEDAKRILSLRNDAHLLLATLLWGNVATNTLLALLAESVLAGLGAFVFSTIGITFFGEIFPQAYLSKNALKTSRVLVPVVKFYQSLLYPFARPTALLLDNWLGKEEIAYFQEEEIKALLHRHAKSTTTDLEQMETLGAINFLSMDDIDVREEGEILHPDSIIRLEVSENGLPVIPFFEKTTEDDFLQQVNRSEEKWVVLTDENCTEPLLVLNSDQFLRDVLLKENHKSILAYCHRPIVTSNGKLTLGEVILDLKVNAKDTEDDVVDKDVILYWTEHEKRIITGADILGRLLRGIVQNDKLEEPTLT